jgi:hypothetical protein
MAGNLIRSAQLTDIRHNHCLNPSFETVLPGTHTTAITFNGVNGYLNTQFPGWKTHTTHADSEITIGRETTIISSTMSMAACKITVSDVTTASTYPRLCQLWNTAELLDKLVYSFRGKYFTFAMEVRLENGVASAVRLYIKYDGTGQTTVYSDYHGNNTNWERLLKTALIPDDCTSIEFGVEFHDVDVDYVYVDNCQVELTDYPLILAPYVPRLPISLRRIVALAGVNYNTPDDYNWHQTGASDADIDFDADFNAIRPAWANMVGLRFYSTMADGRSPSGAVSVSVRAANIEDSARTCYPSPYSELQVELELGQDGQLEVKSTTTAAPYATCNIYPVLWIGVEL